MVSPYTIDVSDERLATIMAKVEAYDWSQLPDAGGWRAGVGIDDLKRLVAYWRDTYDWRKVERRLNQLPNFTTDIEGEHIHFVHIQGNGSKPPVLLLHGWPGSFLEFERLLDPLAADGHDVVVPSLPGFAFSKPITGIIGPRRAAELMHCLMVRLFGPSRYVVQGGDWGHGIAGWIAYNQPDALLGFHINMVNLLAEDVTPTTTEERDFVAKRDRIFDWESGYNHEQETRPQTLGVAMADSPVGAAGWILEKFGKWADLPTTADGSPDIWSKFSEEELLTHIMLYVAPSSVVTATWMYYGKRLEGSQTFPAGTRIQVPTGVAAFPDPVFVPPPRSFAEKTYNIVHWSDMTLGGHFAALEQPELMLADLRAFIATVSGERGLNPELHFMNEQPVKSVETDALHIAYVESGPSNGWPVILSHGFPYDVHAFDDVAPILARGGARVIAPYTRGFGPTRFVSDGLMRSGQQAARGADIIRLAAALELDRPILGGFDWGGNASCVAAALWPERIGGLVSYAGYDVIDVPRGRHPVEPSLERVFWYQHLFQTERGRECLMDHRRELCRILWSEWSPGWQFDDATFARSATSFDNPDFVDVVIHCYRCVFGLEAGDPALQSLEDRLAQKPAIKVPAVTIDGAIDPLKPGGTAEHACMFVAQHEHRVVDAGHNLPQQEPQAFADAVMKVRGWLI